MTDGVMSVGIYHLTNQIKDSICHDTMIYIGYVMIAVGALLLLNFTYRAGKIRGASEMLRMQQNATTELDRVLERMNALHKRG